jgi:hypothetical protein
MGAAVVIADVLAKDALGVALAEDHDVVETVATERPHHAGLHGLARPATSPRARGDLAARPPSFCGVQARGAKNLAAAATTLRRRSITGEPSATWLHGSSCAAPLHPPGSRIEFLRRTSDPTPRTPLRPTGPLSAGGRIVRPIEFSDRTGSLSHGSSTRSGSMPRPSRKEPRVGGGPAKTPHEWLQSRPSRTNTNSPS